MSTILEPQPQPRPTLNLSDYPQEHIPLLLNSILCEECLGFTRELVSDREGGTRFEWTGQGANAEITHELFDFVRNDAVAFDFAVRFVDRQQPPMGFQIIRVPEIDMPGRQSPAQFMAFLLRINTSGGGEPFAESRGFRAGATIALLIAGQLNVDIAARHRELFPAHYMKLS